MLVSGERIPIFGIASDISIILLPQSCTEVMPRARDKAGPRAVWPYVSMFYVISLDKSQFLRRLSPKNLSYFLPVLNIYS